MRFSTTEVRSVLAQLDGTCWPMANLLYGSGLRLMEAHRLRTKDLLLDRGEVIVRDAKGGRDRVTVLPAAIIAPIREHLAKLFDRFRRQRKLREQELLGHADVKTTMIYTHVVGKGAMGVKSPLDRQLESFPASHCITGYSVIRRLSLYYAGSPGAFSFNFSELLWPTPHHQIRTSSIPLVWCWASSSFSRSSCSVSRAPSGRILRRKRC